jgi:hypothetical protein
MADDDEQADRAKDEPVAGDDAIDWFRSILVESKVADVTAFYFIDSQQKDNEDDSVDKRFLQLHDIGFKRL